MPMNPQELMYFLINGDIDEEFYHPRQENMVRFHLEYFDENVFSYKPYSAYIKERMDFIIGHWNNVFDKIHHRDYHDEYIWQECLKAIKENTNDNVVDLGRFICSLMMHLREHEDVFHRMITLLETLLSGIEEDTLSLEKEYQRFEEADKLYKQLFDEERENEHALIALKWENIRISLAFLVGDFNEDGKFISNIHEHCEQVFKKIRRQHNIRKFLIPMPKRMRFN